jgi:hypothetical protein
MRLKTYVIKYHSLINALFAVFLVLNIVSCIIGLMFNPIIIRLDLTFLLDLIAPSIDLTDDSDNFAQWLYRF